MGGAMKEVISRRLRFSAGRIFPLNIQGSFPWQNFKKIEPLKHPHRTRDTRDLVIYHPAQWSSNFPVKKGMVKKYLFFLQPYCASPLQFPVVTFENFVFKFYIFPKKYFSEKKAPNVLKTLINDEEKKIQNFVRHILWLINTSCDLLASGKEPPRSWKTSKISPKKTLNTCTSMGCVMTSNNYRIINSQSQRIVHSEVQWAFKEC